MTSETFAAWVAHMKATRRWSGRECGRRLGCDPKQIARWSTLTAPPAYIGLACAALVADMTPWSPALSHIGPFVIGGKDTTAVHVGIDLPPNY